MKAIVHDRFGSADVLRVAEIERPEQVDDGVLVRVRVASVNPADWYGMAGRPYVGRVASGLRGPRQPLLGVDFAGVVEAVGKDAADLRPGDEVYGGRTGSLAEYVCVRVGVARKPANLSFEQAAAVPVAAVTALQALRDKGTVEPGQRVLVNGASGGVGTFAIQLAKAFDAEVTGVCSTDKVELVRSLGADRVVDYTQADFSRENDRYDLIVDIAGSRSWSDYKRVLEPGGALVLVGGSKKNRLLGPLGHVIRIRLASLPGNRRTSFFIAKVTRPDLDLIRELIEAGKVTPVVERTYGLSSAADAFSYLGEGHVHGKLVVTVP
jgi:NADPH:quinone reductase-like Zn-dependent oxidoreductase